MEGYTSSGSDRHMTSMKGSGQNVPSRVTALTSTLQATNKNLHSVDQMLENYKDLGEQQASAMDKLREDLLKTSVRLKEERRRQSQGGRRASHHGDGKDRTGRRYPTSPLKDYEYDRAASDYDERDAFSPSRRRNVRGGGNVRFFDDMDTSEHAMHQSLRDVTSGHNRLEDDLNKEITRRNRFEFDSTRAMQSVADSLKHSSVDQRLETIHSELQNERKLLQKNQDQVGHLSTQLKQALTGSKSNLSKEEELQLRNQLTKTGTEKTHVLTELDKAKRKLSQVDANTALLVNQVDDMRRQLLRAEEEKQHLKQQMEKQEQARQERLGKSAYEDKERDVRERERMRLEEEVRDLRVQLTKSLSAAGDSSDTRRELERSERQRAQLSDHIEVLQKEVETSERQGAKVIKALQEMSENYNRAETQRQQLDTQLQEALKRLKEYTRERDGLSGDLRQSQAELTESQRKREEMKYRAQETVRQWKAKCKRLEKELGATQLSGQQAGSRVEQLSKELENSRHQAQHTAHQLEVIRREFNQGIALRAQQEEEVRVKDIQVNELKSFKSDLERDCRDGKVVIERLEHELHMVREKGAGLYEEKLKVEDALNSMQQGHLAAQTQIQQLQNEVKQLSLVRVELSAQLAEAANQRQELKAALKDSRRNEASTKEEVDSLVKRVKEDKHHSKHKLGSLAQELKSYRSGEVQAVQSVNHQRKKELVEYQADLQALKVELEDSRTNSKRLKKQNEKLKNEIDRLNADLAKSQEDVSTLQHRYQMVREEYISRSQMSEDGFARAKELELELIDAKETARRTEKDHTNILHTIAAEIDGVVEVAAMGSIETYKALTLTKNPAEPNGILAEVKSKLAWLKQELREFREKEARLKCDMKDVVLSGEKDRRHLVAELERQSEVLEQLAFHRPSTTEKDLNIHDLSSSCLQVSDLKVEKTREESDLPGHHDNSILLKSQEEKEKIHERYSKLQETMTALRQELCEQKPGSDYDLHYTQENHLRSPDSRHQKRALTLTKNPAEPNGILAEVKSKLAWLKQELREFREKEARLKCDMKDVVLSGEKDRRHLVAELERQSEVLEQLAFHRPSTTEKDLNIHDLSSSCLQVSDLKVEKTREESDLPGHHDNSVLLKSQEEKEKIHERYSKLQETMTALRQELCNQKPSSEYDLHYTQENHLRSPDSRHQKRVRINTPSTREYSPSRIPRSPTRSPSRYPSPSRSPRRQSPGRDGIPLLLSDEEFQRQFLPKSPPRFQMQENGFM